MNRVKAAAVRAERRLQELTKRRDVAQKIMKKRPTREAIADYLDACAELDAAKAATVVHIS